MITEEEARAAADRHRSGGYATEDGVADDEVLLIEWAMQKLTRRDWQDELNECGWYWLEQRPASRGPTFVYTRDGMWYFDSDFMRRSVTGRVCKITERPA